MKYGTIGFLIAAALLCTGASVWEGAAAAAPGGALPETGYYAATNSFPRNTVVDIINLENGRSIRVIVASGLDAPGLLAVLSHDAAKTIGLQNRSIGRIRMTQPADPVAFSRFTEGMASGGDPDEDLRLPAPDKTVYVPDPDAKPVPPPALPPPYPTAAFADESMAADIPDIADTPDAAAGAVAGASANADAFEAYPEPEEGMSATGSASVSGKPGSAYVLESEWEESYSEIVDLPGYYSPPGEGDGAWEGELPPADLSGGAFAGPDTPAYVPPGGSLPAEDGASLAEAPARTGSDPISSYRPRQEDEGQARAPAPEEKYRYDLVPAEERPPRSSEEYSGEYRSPEKVPPAAPRDTPPRSSAPVIGGLERGKYYVQLGAFSRMEAAEDAVFSIGESYPLAIQSGSSGGKTVYRVLLGPLNRGESGAVLQRFKSIGYTGAFVRQGG